MIYMRRLTHEMGHRAWEDLSVPVQQDLANKHAKAPADFGRLISELAEKGYDKEPERRFREAFAEVFSEWILDPDKLLRRFEVDRSEAVRFFIEQVASRFVFTGSDGRQYVRFYLPNTTHEFNPFYTDIQMDKDVLTYDDLKRMYSSLRQKARYHAYLEKWDGKSVRFVQDKKLKQAS